MQDRQIIMNNTEFKFTEFLDKILKQLSIIIHLSHERYV